MAQRAHCVRRERPQSHFAQLLWPDRAEQQRQALAKLNKLRVAKVLQEQAAHAAYSRLTSPTY